MDIKKLNGCNPLTEKWEQKGRQRITEILNLTILRKLNKERGKIGNPREAKHRLSEKLIIEHGRDLLSNKEIRNLIGKGYGLTKKEIPEKWTSGSASARDFTDIVDLPEEFYGEKQSKPPDYELVQKTIPYELQDFQKEMVEKILQKLGTSENRFIVSLPTGSGKTTITISSVLKHIVDIEDSSKKNIIWIAHTEELCEQAYKSFKSAIDNMKQGFEAYIFRFWKSHVTNNIENLLSLSADNVISCITVCTPLKFYNLISENENLRDLFTKKTSVVIIDEAHRAGAKTYQNIIEKISQQNNSVSFIGVTATPYRMEYNNLYPKLETQKLANIFNSGLIFPNRTLGNDLKKIKQKLIEQGYLSNPVKITVDTGKKIEIEKKELRYYQSLSNTIKEDRKIQKQVDKQPRRHKILEFIKKENLDHTSKVIYFGPSQSDVKEMCYLLRKSGYTANYMLSDTKNSTRKKIIKDFSSGNIQFLCNCEILTTGFDEPKISHVIMARPTISQVLYEQMIGRGLRGEKFGGTKTCRILSCEDINFPGGYNSFYEFWRKETPYWDYETLFIRTLIYLSFEDDIFAEEEHDYIQKAYIETFKKAISNKILQQEINIRHTWINDYFKNLDWLSCDMTDQQKQNLLSRCEEVIRSDGHIDESEKKLLDSIKYYLLDSK